jgi:alpha-tubulin suppressor-like RCC1 family protein
MVHRYIRAAALLLFGLLNFSALQAGALPESPNTVLEATGPGLSRLDVRFSIEGKELPGAELKSEKDLVVGGVTLPSEGPADYEITAFDREGKATHYGKGSIPAPGVEDRPVVLAVPPTGDSDALVVSLTRERLVLSVKEGEPNQLTVHLDLLDPLGNPTKIDPLEIRWGLTDERNLKLVPIPDKYDVVVVPNKGLTLERLCITPPEVYACIPNGHCRPIPICADPYTTISAGANHTCALTKSGLAYCWGLNGEGQLGAATTTGCYGNQAFNPTCNPKPLPVTCPAGAPCRFNQISAGTTLTAAIDTNGDAWWWGRGGVAHHKVTATLGGNPVKFWSIAAGYGHACAISQGRSEIWCWGTNAYGEAGLPARTPYEVPDWAPTRVLAPLAFKKIVAGGEHTCAIGSTGVDVVCFGRDDYGVNQTKGTSYTQFPAGTGQFYFQQFGGLTSILDVATSADSSCVTVPWGVKCWGRHLSTNVASFASPDRLTAGEGHVCTISNQLASCVGTNNWGELGTGNTTTPSAPVAVKAPPSLYAVISAGAAHTCGVTPDGNAYCWGDNLAGQVGTGAVSVNVKEPALVSKP